MAELVVCWGHMLIPEYGQQMLTTLIRLSWVKITDSVLNCLCCCVCSVVYGVLRMKIMALLTNGVCFFISKCVALLYNYSNCFNFPAVSSAKWCSWLEWETQAPSPQSPFPVPTWFPNHLQGASKQVEPSTVCLWFWLFRLLPMDLLSHGYTPNYKQCCNK